MDRESLIINFNYRPEPHGKSIPVEAIVEAGLSTASFFIHSFRQRAGQAADNGVSNQWILPPVELRHIEKGGKMLWIHSDSETESHLSYVIGKAIEEIQSSRSLKNA